MHGTALILLLAVTSLADPPKPAEPKLSDEESAVLAATNAERKTADLPPLTIDPILLKMARDHSATQARLDQLGHDLDGTTFQERMKASGYKFARAGENVGGGYATAKDAIKGWMESAPHKENLLNKEFTQIGIGMAVSPGGKRYWTQVFAAPSP